MEARELTSAIWDMQSRIDRLEAERRTMVDAEKLRNLILTAKQVAEMHGVSVRTVQSYAGAGQIALHPSSTDGKMTFRASDALKLNFRELRKKKTFLTQKAKWENTANVLNSR